MKPYITQSILLLVAGVLFLIAAPQYARQAYIIPTIGSGTTLEAAFGIPAIVFTIAGCLGVIASVVNLVSGLGSQNRY